MNRQKPFIVEFTGTPEAGKTTTIHIIYELLTSLGYKVKLYPESAESTPHFFPKKSIEANIWRNFDTFKHVLEAPYQSDYDIIILDRGAIDRTFWVYLDSIYDFTSSVKNAPFLGIIKDYNPDLLITLIVTPEEAIKRKGGEGTIVTKEFICNYNNLLTVFINSIGINKTIICTDNRAINDVVDEVQKLILENVKKEPSP